MTLQDRLIAALCLVGLHPVECSDCETYQCEVCRRRVDWANGGADDMPEACDDCWAEAHEIQDAMYRGDL